MPDMGHRECLEGDSSVRRKGLIQTILDLHPVFEWGFTVFIVLALFAFMAGYLFFMWDILKVIIDG